MEYNILENINSPQELKRLPEEKIEPLCNEIREFLIDNVERSGGHLASNLGAVELTVALHRVFDSPSDHIIFDVGHQSYVHKMLTGRRDSFDTLRKFGGLSGFTKMSESEHDAFGAGHSSTSISAALGYAESDKLKGSDAYTVAVMGDGAYTGGMIHEALNNCTPDLRLIIILNENGMSISVNKGRFASYLSRARASKGYREWKRGTKTLLSHLPLIGRPLSALFGYVKSKIKTLFLSSNYFEDLGLYYIGVVDGNNYKATEEALKEAKALNKCVVVHLKTKKGKGYPKAEEFPDDYHSVNSLAQKKDSFHSIFAEKLTALADTDEKIVGVTAAMGIGTGLNAFEEKHKDRYFDVGIAEGHALTFSAGLAANGYKPYVAIYSTFLQRGYDSIIHDICLQSLPVKIIIDRAGISLSDGATHHGIFDVAFLSHIPNIEIFAPATYGSLRSVLDMANSYDRPIAIRYSNSSESERVRDVFYGDGDYGNIGMRTSYTEDKIPEYLFVSYGKMTENVLIALDILSKRGISAGVVLMERLTPDEDMLTRLNTFISKAKFTLFVEEGIKNGGLGMILESKLMERGCNLADKYEVLAIDDSFVEGNALGDAFESLHMDADSLAEKIIDKERTPT